MNATTVPALLRARAQERPDDVAITQIDGGDITYAEWHAASERAASALIDGHGVRPGDRVTLVYDGDWVRYAVAYVGIQRAGAAVVVANARMGAAQIARLTERAGAVGWVEGLRSGDLGGAAWRVAVDALTSEERPAPPAVPIGPDDDAEIIATSGTTGTPKLVAASHANVTHTVNGRPGVAARSILHALTPATTIGQGLLIQALSATPHRLLVLPEWDARKMMEAVAAQRPTHVVLIPLHARSLIAEVLPGLHDTSSVRVVRSSTAPIHPAELGSLAALFEAAELHNVLSSTEAWPARVRTIYDPTQPDSMGQPAPGSEVRIVDDAGHEVGAGVTGHVFLRCADAQPRRYVGDADEAAEVFDADGWVRTGDLGSLDAQGRLYLHGRASTDVINSGGVKISAPELERWAAERPDVREAAAVGLPHHSLGEYAALAVVPSGQLDRAALADHLAACVGEERAPKRIFVLDDLPRTHNDKVSKPALRDLLASMRADDGQPERSDVDPAAVAEIIEIYRDELAVSEVDERTDFLAFGGDSLSAAAISRAVQERLGRAVRLRDLYEAPTLREYARRVMAAAPVAPAASPEAGEVGPSDGDQR